MTEVLQPLPQTAEITPMIPPVGGDGVAVGGDSKLLYFDPLHPPRNQFLAEVNASTGNIFSTRKVYSL